MLTPTEGGGSGKKNPSKFSDGTPAPAVSPDTSLAPAMRIIDPRPEQTQFADLPVTESGAYKANQERWTAVDNYARVLGSKKTPTWDPVLGYTTVSGGTPEDQMAVEEARKRVDEANKRVATWSERMARPIQDYPTLAMAMLQHGDLRESDVRRLVNLASAWTAADAILTAPTMQAGTNIFLSLPDPQKMVVQDIIKEQQQQALKAADDAAAAEKQDQESAGPLRRVGEGIGEAAGLTFSPVLNVLNETTNAISHLWRTEVAGYQYRESLPAGVQSNSNILTDPFLFWNKTNSDDFNQTVVDQARKEYGDVPVDLILEIYKLESEGDKSAITTVEAKYANDPERLKVIDNLVFRKWDDPARQKEADKILLLADKLKTASTGDFGQMLTTMNPLTGAPVSLDNWWRASDPQTVLSGVTNITQQVVSDPTIIGFKGYGAYKAARYGLEKLAAAAAPEGIEAAAAVTRKVLSSRAVNSYLTDMTGDIARYNAMKEAGQDTAKFAATISKRYRQYFPEDLIVDLTKARVHTPEEFIDYVQSKNIATSMALGEVADGLKSGAFTAEYAKAKAAQIEGNSIFGRMLSQQGERRATPLVPRRVNAMFVDDFRRNIGNAVNGLSRGGVSQELKNITEASNDPNVTFGMMLNDNAAEFGNAARLKVTLKDLKGQSIGSATFGNIAKAWDKTARLLSTTPGKQAIYTLDARDTDVFYKFARMHVSARDARALAERWRNADQGERVLMWIGMVRTSTYARGFEDIAKMTLHLPDGTKTSVSDYVKTLNIGERPDVRYSPESLILQDGDRQIQLSTILSGTSAEVPPAIAEKMADILRVSPSEFNGIEHPLHLWQTSDYLAVPNMNELQRITKRNAIVNAIRGTEGGQDLATKIVNNWSLINLAGPRYATRNAIEDWVLYALTGGYFMDAVKGWGIQKGVRELRGQTQGIVSRVSGKAVNAAGKALENSDGSYSFWNHVIRPHLTKEEVATFQVAVSEGDLATIRNLSSKSMLRSYAGRFLDPEDERYMADFLSSHAGYTALDNTTELAHNLGTGRMPVLEGAGDNSGAIAAEGNTTVVYPRGQYTDIKVAGGSNPARFTYWHRNIEGTINRDGSIGKIAVANLDNPEKAIKDVAKALASDTKHGYKAKLSAFYDIRTAASDDEFARRYVQDVLNQFSTADGSLNRALWRKFVAFNEDGTRTVQWASKDGEAWAPHVTVKDLSELPNELQPRFVLGREVSGDPFQVDMTISDKVWSAMGNAVSRISREPIFFANYLRARKQLASYEAELAKGMGDDIAADIATRHALDRATSVTLAYTDNPSNQTVLAWRLRNWARYYRATEDFYRRVYRMAKFEPVGFYKAYLTLNALEDQGFIYNDEYGDKYFMYPGDSIVNNVLGQVQSRLTGGNSMLVGSTPLTFGGKVKMLAPSFDPNSALPMLGGPLAALSVKTIINVVPQFASIEKYVTGEYSLDKSVLETALPAPLLRIMAAMDPNTRNTAYASAYVSAVKVLTAAGKMPPPGADDADYQQALSTVAGNILGSRWATGFLYAASPQVMENDVTTFAREHGIPSMNADYRMRVQKFRDAGETDPYGMAMAEGVATFGIGYTVYGQPENERPKGMMGTPELNYAQGTLDFVDGNKALVKKYPAASMFLVPQSGDFSMNTLRYLTKQGFRQSLDAMEYAKRAKFAEGNYIYETSKKAYEDAVASAQSDADRKAADDKWTDTKTAIYGAFPGLQAYRKELYTNYDQGATDMLNRSVAGNMRSLVDDYYAGKFGKSIPKSIEYIGEALSTYDYYKSKMDAITGQSNAENTAKKNYKLELLGNLRSIAQDDPNADMFIRRVMYVLLKADSDGNLKNG